MKFEKNSRYATIAVYAFFVLAAALIFHQIIINLGNIGGAVKTLAGYVQPIIYGLCIAFLLNPLMRLLDDRLLPWISRGKLGSKPRRAISILLTYLVTSIFIGLFLLIALPQLTRGIGQIISDMDIYLGQINSLYNNFTKWLAGFQIITEPQGAEEAGETLIDLSSQALSALAGMLDTVEDKLQSLMPSAISATARFTSGLFNVILGVIISIYFLADREKLFAQLRKVTLAILPEKAYHLLYDLAKESNRVFSGFIVGKVIDSVIIGILCFIFMCILNPQIALLVAIIVGVSNMIPYFGPFIGAIPSFLLVFISDTQKGAMQSLVFLLFILVLQQFDGNILGPKILGDTTGLSSLWVIFAIMFFGGAFGVLGMFIGVPLFALIYTLCKRIFAYILRRKGLSANTRDYASERNPLIK